MSHADNKKALGYANLSFTGVNLPEELQHQPKGQRQSFIQSARSTVLSMYV